MKRIIAGLLALAVFAVAAPGCGGGGGGEWLSKAEYEQRVAEIGTELRARFGELGAATTDPSNLGRLADPLDTLGKALDQAAARLSDLKPPKEVQTVRDTFVKAAHDLADLVRDVADKVQDAPRPELLEIRDELDVSRSDAFKRLQEAVEELKAKGYELGTIGS